MKSILFISISLFFVACNQTAKQDFKKGIAIEACTMAAPQSLLKSSNASYGITSNANSTNLEDAKVDVGSSNDKEKTATNIVGDLSGSVSKNASTLKQKLIRDANITIQVEDYQQAKKSIHDLIKKSNGYVSNEQESKGDEGMTSNLTIRCTPDGFDNLINSVVGVATYVENKTIKAEDVTADYYDLQTRIKTKKEEEQQYISILHRAGKISDILEVENQLRVIREEIESAEGRIRLMNDQVNYSTIELSFYEKGKAVMAPDHSFLAKMKDGLFNGWNIVLSFVLGLFNIWPIVIIGLLIFFLVKRKIQKIRKNQPE